MTRLRVSRLGRDPNHRKHMFRTMTTQLFKHERIKTTLPKVITLQLKLQLICDMNIKFVYTSIFNANVGNGSSFTR